MESTRFDDLTKALATSSTRRAALRRIGGIFAGVSLAGLFPGLAFAKNKTCAQFCAAVFGDNTPAAEQCTADAAHGRGLCSSCGSNTPASSICCTRNSSGFCSSYGGAHCCGRNATCLNDNCCATANVCGSTCLAAPCDSSQCLTCDSSTGTCVGCPLGQTCQGGHCVPTCTAIGGTCSGNGDCCSGLCDYSTSICVSCIPSGHDICFSYTDCCSRRCDYITNTCQ